MESLNLLITTTPAQILDDDFDLLTGVWQSGQESPPLFNLFMDFIMDVFLGKWANISVKFLQPTYRIPASTMHSKRTTVGQHTLDFTLG